MKLIRKLVPSLVLAMAVLTGPLQARTGANGQNIAGEINLEYQIFTLDNGLTTIVYTDRATPTVYVGMYFGVGSKDEPPGKTGFAHLFEHLMFQGTENREGEYFEPFTKAGATGMNGTTNQDRTNYYATVPTGALDMALWMESDRMAHLLGAVTQEALDEQRDVVKNEKRQGENRPYSSLLDRVLEGLFPVGHPYRHNAIGSMEDLDNATVQDVHEWFEKYYGASNALLVLAGDIDLETAREKVTHYFSEVPPGEPLVKRQEWVPELQSTQKDIAYDRVGLKKLVRAWTIPNVSHRDTTLMYLVNETLVRNKNAPLYSKLVDDLQLATSVSSSAFGQVLAGIQLLTVDLRPGSDPDQVYRIIDEVIDEYIEKGPDEALLENAKLAVNMWLIGSMESKARIGALLAEGQLFSGNPLQIKQDLEWLNTATAEDLRLAAKRWLGRHHYQLTFVPFPEYQVAETGVDRSEVPEVGEVGGVQFPPIETAVLDNGIKLTVARRDAIPLVNVQVRVGTGQTANTQPGAVTSEAAWFMLNRGTRSYDANQLAAAKDKIAMSTATGPGEETSTISYSILTTYLDESLELVHEMLRYPTFPEHELVKFKANVNAILDNIERNPVRFAPVYFNQAIYGHQHPLAAIWSRAAIAGLSGTDLKAFMQREVAPDNIAVYMVGDVTLEQARASIEEAFGDWNANHASARQSIGKALAPRARVILLDHPGAVQAQITAGHAIPPFDASESTELTVMNGIFGGGFEARINMNLREDKGWAYGIYSGIDRNTSGDQALKVSGSVQIDKTVESMREIRKEFEQFIDQRPATHEELNREVLNGSRSIPAQFETSAGFLGSIASADLYGLPLDHAEGRAERLRALAVSDINRRAREIMRPNDLTWVVIGDLSQIEAPIREAGFGEVEVWDTYGNRIR
ncbi:MAG: insulinase family protein [Xanthomonadales bacterium]|nr:insulinase family protein [Xanthomonadales bacterium]